jgi:hypothetical protein
MAGAIPLVPLNGTPQPPEGYYLPTGTYSVRMSGYASAHAGLSVFEPGAVYRFNRSDADPSEADRFIVGDGFGYRSGDDSVKSIVLAGIARLDSGGVEYSLNAMVAPGESLHLRSYPDGSLTVFASPGPGLTADIGVNLYAAGSMRNFSHDGIDIPGGSSTRFLPADDSLSALLMLVDSSADGSVDDTLYVSNQLTSLGGDREWGIPSGFWLDQNYPNPFNPSTEIRYALPERSMVSLVVYDLLGREVATLVDREQEAGYHSVRWDASGVPAGIYVYRLNAGGSSESRKMVVLK